jgi:hypothetical protein
VYEWTGSTAQAAVAIGLALACERAFALGIAAVAAALWLPPVHSAIAGALGPLTGDAGFEISAIVHTALVFALAFFASRSLSPAISDSPRAVRGLQRAATALWFRVVGVVAAVGLTLLVIIAGPIPGALSVMRFVTFSAAVLAFVSLLVFGLGAIGAASARVADLPRIGLAIAGAASLWCAGIAGSQLPEIYTKRWLPLYVIDTKFGNEWADQLTIAVPIVAIAAIALVALAIIKLAQRCGDAVFAGRATGTCAMFVVLSFAGTAVQLWMLPKASSRGDFMMLGVAVVVALCIATATMARLCRDAAALIEREPGLPPAKLVL